MSVYSYGKDSPLKFEVSDEFAERYNTALKDFFNAQLKYKEETGQQWDGSTALYFEFGMESMNALNEFGPIFDEALESHGKPVNEEDIHDDYLIKN